MTTQSKNTAQHIVLTRQQLEDIQKFKVDLKKGKAEFAYNGTMPEVIVFLEGVKKIVNSFSH